MNPYREEFMSAVDLEERCFSQFVLEWDRQGYSYWTRSDISNKLTVIITDFSTKCIY